MASENRPSGSALPVAAGLVALFAAILWVNLDLPLVRNGITYARTAEAIVEAGFDPLAVNADWRNLYGRPIGFPLVSSPLVPLAGANRGLKIASFLSTAAWLGVACWFLVRTRREAELGARLDAVDLLLLGFNPLIVYQAWSAHPDALFSAAFLVALILADRMVTTRPAALPLLAVALFVTVYAAIELKYYGGILIGIVPVYAAIRSRGAIACTILPAASCGLVLLLVLLGIAGLNPTLSLTQVSGLSNYETALVEPATLVLYVAGSVVTIAVFLLVVLGPGVAGLLMRPRLSPVSLALGAAVALFVAGLLPFRGTTYNLRYFMPVLPILVLAAREGLNRLAPRTRRLLLIAFLVTQSALIANFNVPRVYEALAPVNRGLEAVRYPGTRRVMAVFDNFRLGHHLASNDIVTFVERDAEPGDVVVIVTQYYGDAAHAFFEDAGLVKRDDVDVRYLLSLRDLVAQAPGGPFWLCVRCDEPLQAPSPESVSRVLGRDVRPEGRLLRVE